MIINNRCEALCPVLKSQGCWTRYQRWQSHKIKSNYHNRLVSVCAQGLVHQFYYKLFTCWVCHCSDCHRVQNHCISQHVFKFYTMTLVLFRRSSLVFVKVPITLEDGCRRLMPLLNNWSQSRNPWINIQKRPCIHTLPWSLHPLVQ